MLEKHHNVTCALQDLERIRITKQFMDMCADLRPEGKRQLGRPKLRWVDNIRTDLQEVRCGYMDWIGLAQDRDSWWTLVSAVMNLRVP